MKFQYYFIIYFFLIGLFLSCEKEQTVEFSDSTTIKSIQAQKFDYTNKIGVGKIYMGEYSPDKDTIYFDVTYYPDEVAPTYEDWQIVATLPSGAIIEPQVGGIKDMSEPYLITVTAPDGSTSSQVTLKMRIYEVPFGELDKGFGRYKKLFELSSSELGGWSAGNQNSFTVIEDELIVNNGNNSFLVYDKFTGEKIEKTIPKPDNISFRSVFSDEDDILLATSSTVYSDGNPNTLNIYRWKNGLNNDPELFISLPTSSITSAPGNHIIGITASIFGSTNGDAQIMLDINGQGSPDTRVLRIPIENGKPNLDNVDVFSSGVATTWGGKAAPMSAVSRNPYLSATLGFPPKMVHVDESGISRFFNIDPNTSNFLNKIISNFHYFEFNNSKYVAITTINWPGDIRLLIFNLDDASLVDIDKSKSDNYNLFNPFMEEASFTSQGDAGDLTVQVQPDGKTALVYVLQVDTGILCYELTNVGTSS